MRVALSEVTSGRCVPSGQFFPIVVASCETHTGSIKGLTVDVHGSTAYRRVAPLSKHCVSPRIKSDYTSCNQTFCLQSRLLLSDYGWTHLAQLKSAWRSLTAAGLTPPDSWVVDLWACGRRADRWDLRMCYISLISPDAGASCRYSLLGVVWTSRNLAWRCSIAEDTNGMT